MKRRSFLKTSAYAGHGLATGCAVPAAVAAAGKTHALTLSFDDGFKKSFYRIAEIHETYGLKACLNVRAIAFR